jgi:hypothetical protein
MKPFRSSAFDRPAGRRGIALIITLLMLSVVTITAVAFLAVSRRERASVASFAEQIDARYVAEAGLNHAQGRLSSRIAVVTNRLAYGGFMVSTNYINPFFRFGQSFLDRRNYRDLTNVAYYRTNGTPLFDLSTDGGRQSYVRMLGNLYYDPRPPVFVQTNRNPQLPFDFRYYLDLNRNGQFETNGFQRARDANGRTNGLGVEWMWGDPEWIGLLQNPDYPHSGTNHFVGRFAYVVVPASQALDINHFGNDAKRRHLGEVLPTPPLNRSDRQILDSGYLRNQGVGTWEINPAGFFAELNTNIWYDRGNEYRFLTNFNQSSQGLAFSDAERLRRFRQEGFNPNPAERFYALESGRPDFARINTLFRNDLMDGYSDGPLSLTVSDLRGRLVDDDKADFAWSGSDLTNHFVELNDLFRPNLDIGDRITGQYTNNANVRQTSPLSSYDRHTFYRLASQLGTDSSDGRFESGLHPAYSDLAEAFEANRRATNPYGFYRRAKLNLNYGPDVPGESGLASASISSFRPWEAVEWFTNAAHRILLSEFTNGLPFRPPGLNSYTPGLAVHGLTVVRDGNRRYLTNYSYDAQVHRAMQVAANIYDGANNRFLGPVSDQISFPSVFRPIFYEDSRSPGVLRLHGYQEILGGKPSFLTSRPWVTPDQATNNLDLSLPEEDKTSRAGFNVFGMPWVVGAKKGLPHFNEALWQTIILPTRRLAVRRPNVQAKLGPNELPFEDANQAGFTTQYQYVITLTNVVGAEAWNSYARAFKRPVRIFATNVMDVALTDETASPQSELIFRRRESLSADQLINRPWKASETIAAAFTTNAGPGRFIQFPPAVPMVANKVPGGYALSTSFIYDVRNREALPLSRTNVGWMPVNAANASYLTPILSVYVTNNLVFSINDEESGRLLDIVTLRSVMVRTNILSVLSQLTPSEQVGGLVDGGFGGTGATMGQFWRTNLLQNSRTRGMDNQLRASLGLITTGVDLWRSPLGGSFTTQMKNSEIEGLKYFLGQTNGLNANAANKFGASLVAQIGFNPSPAIYLNDRRMANDPLVHYTMEDLAPGFLLYSSTGYAEIKDESGGVRPPQITPVQAPDPKAMVFDVGRRPKAINPYAPWGTNANLTGAPPNASTNNSNTAFDYAYKDPLVRSSDDWNFPAGTNAFFRYAGIGQLGRIHRGSPWQTLYLKSKAARNLDDSRSVMQDRYQGGIPSWGSWAGNRRTAPTNDWKYLDLFTAAYNENAARGQLGVNQTNVAAWSAVLSAVPLLRNTDAGRLDDPQPFFLEPGSPEMREIMTGRFSGSETKNGITTNFFYPGVQTLFVPPNFTSATSVDMFSPYTQSPVPNLGSILQVPMLSDKAPFLRTDLDWSKIRNISDEVLERLPQQVLSLLRADEPRFVIYSYGQTLKPAQNAISLRPGPLYGMSTNYTITGEYVTKTVLRLDGDPRRLEPIIEDQRVVLSNP